MKTLVILLVFLTLTLANSSHAQKPAPKSALLYEITGPDIKESSYLFGTIHIICSKDMFPADRFDTYFNKTKQLYLEFDMDDPAVLQNAVGGSMLTDGKGVKNMVTAEEFSKIDAVFKDYLGISFDYLQGFKPMAASALLMTSPKVVGCPRPVMYDNQLAQRAGERKMPVLGLETAAEQIAVFDSVPLEKQVKDLVKTASDPAKDMKEFQSLYRTYLAQDSDALYDVAADGMRLSGYSQEKMLDMRNANWIPIIEREVRNVPTFFAVGAGHLGGKNGVVALLRAKGLTLRPIKL
jgi:uncharacterized protein